MAYAAYQELFGIQARGTFPARPYRPDELVVMDITEPSRDAFQVRQLLARGRVGGVLRCWPRLQHSQARLEVMLPAKWVAQTMHDLMEQIPSGEIGQPMPWHCYVAGHGCSHGF